MQGNSTSRHCGPSESTSKRNRQSGFNKGVAKKQWTEKNTKFIIPSILCVAAIDTEKATKTTPQGVKAVEARDTNAPS